MEKYRVGEIEGRFFVEEYVQVNWLIRILPTFFINMIRAFFPVIERYEYRAIRSHSDGLSVFQLYSAFGNGSTRLFNKRADAEDFKRRCEDYDREEEISGSIN